MRKKGFFRADSEDERALNRIKDVAVARLGRDWKEQPASVLCSRRELVCTGAGVLAVSFIPISLSQSGCDKEDAREVIRLLLTVLSLAAQTYTLGTTIGGHMQFDNQSGAPLSIEVLFGLINLLDNDVDDDISQVVDVDMGTSPMIGWEGPVGIRTGDHQVEATAMTQMRLTDAFRIEDA